MCSPWNSHTGASIFRQWLTVVPEALPQEALLSISSMTMTEWGCLPTINKRLPKQSKLTFTLMILLLKLLRMTTTSFASGGESVPSWLREKSKTEYKSQSPECNKYPDNSCLSITLIIENLSKNQQFLKEELFLGQRSVHRHLHVQANVSWLPSRILLQITRQTVTSSQAGYAHDNHKQPCTSLGLSTQAYYWSYFHLLTGTAMWRCEEIYSWLNVVIHTCNPSRKQHGDQFEIKASLGYN